jgi:hypothetical protein
LAKGDPAAAQGVLTSLETKYAKLPWLGANKASIDALRAAAKTAIREAEAEKVYAQAVGLLEKKELFDLRPLVEQLKTSYASTSPVTDAARKPPFAELEKAVAGLGRRIVVRQDGKGDFTSIQAAVDAAPPKSLVEIQDSGTYNEEVSITKEGLTLRGRRGSWPIITSTGPLTNFSVLVGVGAPGVVLERLALLHGGGAGNPQCLAGQVSMRSCIAWPRTATCNLASGEIEDSVLFCGVAQASRVRNGVFVTGLGWTENAKIENALLCYGGSPVALLKVELRRCTSATAMAIGGPDVRVIDCILPYVQYWRDDAVIEHCNVYGNPPFIDKARAGKGCFLGDPQFVDPQKLDYSLRPTSPCRGRASDGGDVGFRYNPEIVEVLKAAFDLRRRGLIQF